MKYTEAIVTFQEVPGEVSLTLSISGCPLRCMYCHSPHLREDIGIPLTVQELARLLEEQVSPHTNLSKYLSKPADLRENSTSGSNVELVRTNV